MAEIVRINDPLLEILNQDTTARNTCFELFIVCLTTGIVIGIAT